MDSVNVLSKLPKNFNELLSSKKWTERKDALELLLNFLSECPILDSNVEYMDLMKKLSRILEKDANINVCALSAKVISKFARGLNKHFHPYVNTFIPIVFEKFKEKKATLRDPLIETVDDIYNTTNLDFIVDHIVTALGKQNPNIKIQTNYFLYRVFKKFDANTAPMKCIKILMPIIIKCTNDSDADTRESACAAIGSIMKAIGKTIITGMIGNVSNDNNKMLQIEKYYEKAIEEAALEVQVENEYVTEDTESSSIPITNEIKPKEIDPWEFADPVDVLSKLPKDFYEQLSSSKWNERKEILELLLKYLNENIRLDPNSDYNELIKKLAKILGKDVNINVCSTVAKVIGSLAKGLRNDFQSYVNTLLPIIFEKFKEKKMILREPLVETIDAVYRSTTLENISEDVINALKKSNPSIKSQTNLFLYRIFRESNFGNTSNKTMKTLILFIGKCTNDSDAETREASFSAIAAAMRSMGKQNIISMIEDVANDKIKMAQIDKAFEKLIEELGPVKSKVVQDTKKITNDAKTVKPIQVPSLGTNSLKEGVKNSSQFLKSVSTKPVAINNKVSLRRSVAPDVPAIKNKNRNSYSFPLAKNNNTQKATITEKIQKPLICETKSTNENKITVQQPKPASTIKTIEKKDIRENSKIPLPSTFNKSRLSLIGSRLPIPVRKY